MEEMEAGKGRCPPGQRVRDWTQIRLTTATQHPPPPQAGRGPVSCDVPTWGLAAVPQGEKVRQAPEDRGRGCNLLATLLARPLHFSGAELTPDPTSVLWTLGQTSLRAHKHGPAAFSGPGSSMRPQTNCGGVSPGSSNLRIPNSTVCPKGVVGQASQGPTPTRTA